MQAKRRNTHLDVKLKKLVMSSIRNSGNMRNPSGVSSGKGRLFEGAGGTLSEWRAATSNEGDEPDANLRVLLVGVDLTNKPGHNEVGKADATREVLGVEQLHFVCVKRTVPLFASFLDGAKGTASFRARLFEGN
jgi:hypothetical protein